MDAAIAIPVVLPNTKLATIRTAATIATASKDKPAIPSPFRSLTIWTSSCRSDNSHWRS